MNDPPLPHSDAAQVCSDLHVQLLVYLARRAGVFTSGSRMKLLSNLWESRG